MAILSKEKNFVSAVVYVRNAEKQIEDFLSLLLTILDSNFEHSEIICVNDASEDYSLEAIRNASTKAKSTSISVVNMSYFHGLEVSMNAGMDLAIGDFVFEFDSTVMDFAQEEVMKVYRRSLEGYDIVSASPNAKERLTSNLFYKVFERYGNLNYHMTTERFRILSRRMINRIGSMNKTVPYRKAIYASVGLKADHLIYAKKEYKIDSEIRDKASRKYRMSVATDSLILFTELGYRFSITMTILMMFVSIFMVGYSIITYLLFHPVAGWTTTILFLSVAFSGLFGILTIIVKYLQLLVNLVFKRKQYSFESIEKLTK